MTQDELLKTRILALNAQKSKAGECVLYVMSRDQRASDNHALIAAQKHALTLKLPLAVVFCLYESSGVRAREHYEFMIAGLRVVEASLGELSIPFMMVIGNPFERLSGVFHHTKPKVVYFDHNPLKGPQSLQARLASSNDIPMFSVDTHNVVPLWVASQKREVGAYTLRPKLHKLLATYLAEPERLVVHPYAWPGTVQPMKALDGHIAELLDKLVNNGTSNTFEPGELQAAKHLQGFIDYKLENYATYRNDPATGSQSDLSPYLHFGQIASLRVALELQKVLQKNGQDLHFLSSPKMPQPDDAENTIQHGVDSLIEEMIVRKELADNFCYHSDYTSLESAPQWAVKSLDTHRGDPREFLYDFETLSKGCTHDGAWNACQHQLTVTGKMHGYMRMYWAKKVLEWSDSPETALTTLTQLNDFYSIDGGDPNGYAGILWSVAGVHDRPWFERDVYGVIRYMNYDGLKRKFNIKAYEKLWA
jgi:deoxyribodipyrimidine photo-lyase